MGRVFFCVDDGERFVGSANEIIDGNAKYTGATNQLVDIRFHITIYPARDSLLGRTDEGAERSLRYMRLMK